MSFYSDLTKSVKKYFISGVLVVVPVILTYVVLKFLFNSFDSILQPLLLNLLGYYIPGLGVLSTILLILLVGVLTRNIVGAKIYAFGDYMFTRLPIIRPIYSSAKQLLVAITEPSSSSFREVALIEYPRKGCYAVSFISHRINLEVDGQYKKMVAVFVPSTPTPISGMVVMIPEEDIQILDLTPEEGIKFLVSGGVASPSELKIKNQETVIADREKR